jgi:DNA-binding NarL/FixJ family response regulator
MKVIIADSQEFFRRGLRSLFADSNEFQIVGEASDAISTITAVRTECADVLALDAAMPGRAGTEIIKHSKLLRPKLRVIVIAQRSECEEAVRAFRAGASGYLTKDVSGPVLLAAFTKVACGGTYLNPAMAERFAQMLNPADAETLPHQRLTNREFDIFRRLVSGEVNVNIAFALHISAKTVSSHRTRILEKMRMHDLTGLVRYAMRYELVVADLASSNNAFAH